MPLRRWDDAALVDFTDRLSSIACECPRHVTELLVQPASLEAYGAECANCKLADAELHAGLRLVAAASGAQFETAFAQVAGHEGLILPPSPSPPRSQQRGKPMMASDGLHRRH